ncbi:MAG TPA: terminase gpA endonuclease subunit [Longimicrobiaceae bacterium]|nr:terminase gpA endonuclease subunit [Longimicrobiaceae bacterium]
MTREVLTAAVEPEQGGLRFEVRGWPTGRLVIRGRLHGDPSAQGVWDSLEQLRSAKFPSVEGAAQGIAAIAINAGCLMEEVYAFVAPRETSGVRACKLYVGARRHPEVIYKHRPNSHGVRLVTIAVRDGGVDTLAALGDAARQFAHTTSPVMGDS